MKQWYPQHRHRTLIGLLGGLFLSVGYIPQLVAEQTDNVSLSELKSGQVILSWEEMKTMLEEMESLKQQIDSLKQQQAETKKRPAEPLPVEYSITESQLTGEVKGRAAHFSAHFSVQILKEGWVKIPFFQNDIGIEAISFQAAEEPGNSTVHSQKSPNAEPNVQKTGGLSDDGLTEKVPSAQKTVSETTRAQFVRDAHGYYLLTKGPQLLSVQVTFRVPIEVNELTYSLSFIPPRAVINHITLTIPEKGVNVVDKTPHSHLIQDPEKGTTIEAVLSERDTLKLGWKVEKDTGMNRKSLAVLHALASIDKSDISVFSTIELKHVASLNQVTFRLPLTVEILNVTSLDIVQWSTEKLKQAQLVKIVGHSDPRTEVKIDISYRLRVASLPAEIAIPLLEMTGTDIFEGFLGVEVIGNLEVNAKRVTNGVVIPAKNLPKKLWQKATSPLLYGYQYYRNTFSPSLSIRGYQEIQTVVANVDRVDCMTHRTLEGKSITRILYFIRNNDRQFLTLTLPKNSRLWQAFLNGKPVKPAQKDTGEILIPMKKSASQGSDLQSFSIEIGYITEVNKLSLKGDIQNELPAIDLPISYLQWSLYLPEYYEYFRFEGPLKQVPQFSEATQQSRLPVKPQIDIPTQGRRFQFEKHLIVEGQPYVRGKYGQFLGNDIFLSIHSPSNSFQRADRYQYPTQAAKPKRQSMSAPSIADMAQEERTQQVIPMH